MPPFYNGITLISEGEGRNHKSAHIMIARYGERYATNPVCNGTTTAEKAKFSLVVAMASQQAQNPVDSLSLPLFLTGPKLIMCLPKHDLSFIVLGEIKLDSC